MKYFLFLFACLVLNFAQAQEQCGTDAIHEKMMAANPEYAKRMRDFDALPHNTTTKRMTPATATYIIPVVVHVMHKGEALGQGTNISDEKIRNMIKFLNQSYSNAFSTSIDTGIQFALAVRNPQGQCTNGITRTNMSNIPVYMENGVAYQTEMGITDGALKALDYWDSNNYYNIWIVSQFDNDTTDVSGYAYYASAHGLNYDGTVIRVEFTDVGQTTATHEIGHALNLYHSFEGDNGGNSCPPAENGCGTGQGDCLADTAAHIRGGDCLATGTNSCYPANTDLNYKFNYMNYAPCKNMFTQQQKDRMIAALTTTRASLLAANGNMSLVPPGAPGAYFNMSSLNVLCSTGQTIKLYDSSSCVPNTLVSEVAWPGITFAWSVTNGENTYTATQQNPEIVIAEMGAYSITLTVTTLQGSSTYTLPNAFNVNNGAAPEPFCIPHSELNGSYGYTVSNVSFNTINRNTSPTMAGPYENFICSDITTVNAGDTYTLSITAGANANNAYPFKVFIDFNNNTLFETTEEVMSQINPNGTTAVYTTQVTVPATAVQGTLLMMRVIGEAGTLTSNELNCNSDLFIGDVEDYGVFVNNALGTSAFTRNTLVVSPNPANDILNISSSLAIDVVTVYNMLGQLVASQSINAPSGTIDISKLSSGTYLVSATSGGSIHQQKVIKQ